MSKAYYASRISDNMAKMPEGFLICYNVPIGRTGTYKYLDSEVGTGDGSMVVDVFRTDDELFADESIASFEGKAFTDDHPIEDVTADNWQQYSKGEVTNVRRGIGEFKDCLVADIIVRDPVVMSEIESGVKREVSSGYTCDYVTIDGKLYQQHIRGNHVALVRAGRAGHRVAIKDQKTVNKNSKLNSKILCLL